MGHVQQLVALWVHTMLVVYLVQRASGQNQSQSQFYNFSDTDRFGLTNLLKNWNTSTTPDMEKNLAGWRDISQDNTSEQLSRCPCYSESWQGVLCLRQLQPTPANFYYQLYKVWIVGLTLTDAALRGSLPSAIGNLTSLASLTITGNKDLKGLLPLELRLLSFNLNILNLQGNNFNGSIPAALGSLRQLQLLDLSENQFNGSLEIDFRNLTWLRTLNLSRNLLGGEIRPEYFHGLGQLISLDLSSNNFTGPLLNLTSTASLNTLNLSSNSFSGDVILSRILNTNHVFNLNEVDLSNNTLTGSLPDFSAWANLTYLDLSDNRFQPALFPIWIKNLTNLEVLRLKGINLTGQIPKYFFRDFKNLKILVLDNNHLSGTFDIEDVTRLPVLELLSITNNNITDIGYYKASLYTLGKFGINVNGNPYCENARASPEGTLKQCICLQKCIDANVTRTSERQRAVVIATSVATSSLAIALLIIGLVFWKTSKEKRKLQLQVQHHFDENDIKPTIFTFNQLRVATQDFSERTKIGEGSFGAVYKGYLHGNADPVAVKQLFIKNQQSITEFLNEVVLVTAIKHRNLVNLRGCCVREDQRILVYEYLDNNDLEYHLFRKGVNQHLPWPSRFNICLGVARGLHYLHTSAQPRIIHRDIKASNILMDRNLQPKIADFGLALFFPDEKSHIITDIAGTRGYWAPEYATMGKLSEKADVYSYGVLLLEVVSGRKNLDYSLQPHKAYLSDWVKELYNESNVMEIVDPMLALTKEDDLEVRRIINIGLLCIQLEPERRPTMGAIVATLEGSLNLDAEEMQHNLSQGRDPSLSWAHRLSEEQPLRKEEQSRMFSSDVTGSSSMISLTSVGNFSSSQGSVSMQKKLGGTSMGAPCGGTMGSSIITYAR